MSEKNSVRMSRTREAVYTRSADYSDDDSSDDDQNGRSGEESRRRAWTEEEDEQLQRLVDENGGYTVRSEASFALVVISECQSKRSRV